jgi:uracil-DNA glycosylase family 4
MDVAIEDHCCDDNFIALDKYLQIGSGAGKNLLAVGESPAANGWRKSGRAFYTTTDKLVPTGKNFLVNLQQIDQNINLENINFTEIAKCFVANNRKILDSCASKTWPHFNQQISFVAPKLIILLGKRTTDIFNGLANVSLVIGELQTIRISDVTYSILPIYHPSPLNPKRIHNAEFVDKNVVKIRELLKSS